VQQKGQGDERHAGPEDLFARDGHSQAQGQSCQQQQTDNLKSQFFLALLGKRRRKKVENEPHEQMVVPVGNNAFDVNESHFVSPFLPGLRQNGFFWFCVCTYLLTLSTPRTFSERLAVKLK
jgi:hypothetical protein